MPKYTTNTNSNPNNNYYVPKSASNTKSNGSILNKIKGFFNSKKNIETPTPNDESIDKNDNKLNKFKNPYLNDNINISAIDLSVNTSNLSFLSKNPNDTLSEFFNKKGDTPLNDIEIEGVLSLIKKSQSRNNSRLPSRNSSTIINHNSLFNNNLNNNSRFQSNLSSFNEGNSTTILRKSSNNLKDPVRISTPTYVSKANKSFNVPNSNKSFNRSNLSGIRKKRIVDYSSLKNSNVKRVSPLSAYIERRKREELNKNEISLTVKEDSEKNMDKPVSKNCKDYTGGIIDLSNLTDSDEDKEIKMITKKPQIIKKENKKISKTASKVLDILNFEDEKIEKSAEPKPVKILEESVKIDEHVVEKDLKPKQIDKPTVPLFKIDPIITKKGDNSQSTGKNNAGINFTPNPVNKIANGITVKPSFSFKPQKNEPVPTITGSKLASTEKKTNVFESMKPAPVKNTNDEINEDNVIHIDSFTFPEVPSPIKSNNPITAIPTGFNTNGGINATDNSAEEFSFPAINALTETEMNLVDTPNEHDQEFSNLFKF